MRAHAAEHDGIYKFQMARIEAKREMNFPAIAHRPIAAVAEMIFHVAAFRPQFRLGVGEFLENFAGIFADDVRQHVEPAAMAHADDDGFHALMAGFFDGEIEQRQKRFAAFERKCFRAEKFCAEKFLENHRVREPRENAELFVAGNLPGGFANFPCGAEAIAARPDRQCA